MIACCCRKCLDACRDLGHFGWRPVVVVVVVGVVVVDVLASSSLPSASLPRSRHSLLKPIRLAPCAIVIVVVVVVAAATANSAQTLGRWQQHCRKRQAPSARCL